MTGARVLIVEDEPLVAMLLEDMLEELGYEVVGPASNLEQGLTLARRERIDAAILDVNLNGARSYAIADVLKERSIPHLFATGYGSAEEVVRRGVEIVKKPFTGEALARTLRMLLGGQQPMRAG